MTIGIAGEISLYIAFFCTLGCIILYALSINNQQNNLLPWLNGTAVTLQVIKSIFVFAAAVILLYIILTHQFQYYYVFNHSNRALPMYYLISVFYGGQEGSILLWLFGCVILSTAFLFHRSWRHKKCFLMYYHLIEFFLISLLLGISIGDTTIGASPFNTLAEAMPKAPFLQSNPDFIPEDGRGLNDLLKNFWMMIHPPMLFLSFVFLTVPFCRILSMLTTDRDKSWLRDTTIWLIISLCTLLLALVLGGYWAYITLSFGGFWAWDPVENASLIPWLLGVAALHTLIIYKRKKKALLSSIVLIMLMYLSVLYESYLTRSGILADQSVHSFVDLGLQEQLLLGVIFFFILCCFVLFKRRKWLTKQNSSASKPWSVETLLSIASASLFFLGMVIILGTSSPIIGTLFTKSPSPPNIDFYNQWSIAFSIITLPLTVLGIFSYYKKFQQQNISHSLLRPLLLASITAAFSIFIGQVTNPWYMLTIYCGFFAFWGNLLPFIHLIKRHPKQTGGVVSHIGFALFVISALVSSAFSEFLLDERSNNYNQAVKAGTVFDEQGLAVKDELTFFELKKNRPTKVFDRFYFTYETHTAHIGTHKMEHSYRIRVEDLKHDERQFYLNPTVYASSQGDQLTGWAAKPDIYKNWNEDLFSYVTGSSYIEELQKSNTTSIIKRDSISEVLLRLQKKEQATLGQWIVKFNGFSQIEPEDLQDSTIIAVKTHITFALDSLIYNTYPTFTIRQIGGNPVIFRPFEALKEHPIETSLKSFVTETGQIELHIKGKNLVPEDWILLVVDQKPFMSMIWISLGIVCFGFLISLWKYIIPSKGKKQ